MNVRYLVVVVSEIVQLIVNMFDRITIHSTEHLLPDILGYFCAVI